MLRPLRFATRDLVTAEEFIRTRWVGLRGIELGPRFSLEVSGVHGDTFSIERMSHTSTLRADGLGQGPLHVLELLAGEACLEADGEVIELRPGDLVAIDGQTTAVVASCGANVGLVTLPRSLLAEAAQVPAERLTFPQRPPVSQDWASHWRNALRHTNREVAARLKRGDTTEDGASRRLAVAALAAFPHELVPVEEVEDGLDGPVGRATAFIDAHADQSLTVGDIARAARTSVRALQQGFARHHDTSPTAYLRRVRLEGAHRDLSRATPDGKVTVADVAARWGFSQPGRFAAHYRQAFGLLPSETLRTRSGR